MSPPDLDPDLAAALQILAELGPLQVLDVHPTPPERRPAPPPASAPAAAPPPQPSLFQPQQPTVPVLTNPHAGTPLSPTPPTWRSHP